MLFSQGNALIQIRHGSIQLYGLAPASRNPLKPHNAATYASLFDSYAC
jgi:hypothetical protein